MLRILKAILRNIIAILFPPLAVSIYGNPIQFLINIPLIIMYWIPGIIHALIIVNMKRFNRRSKYKTATIVISVILVLLVFGGITSEVMNWLEPSECLPTASGIEGLDYNRDGLNDYLNYRKRGFLVH